MINDLQSHWCDDATTTNFDDLLKSGLMVAENSSTIEHFHQSLHKPLNGEMRKYESNSAL